MRQHLRTLQSLLVIIAVIAARQSLPAQELDGRFQFTAPRPDARFVPPVTSIILRPGGELRSTPDALRDLIRVTGGISGDHTGSVVIADDRQTIIFTPDEPFACDEQVIVYVREGIRLRDGGRTDALSFAFQTSDAGERLDSYPLNQAIIEKELEEIRKMQGSFQEIQSEKNDRKHLSATSLPGFLPGDYPWYRTLQHQSTAEGYVFVAPFRGFGDAQVGMPYVLILDNEGGPLFFRRVPGGAFDFKVQPKGTLTYFDNAQAAQAYVELDSAYRKIDEWTMKNGYGTDLHGIQLLADGHALITSYDFQQVDMSLYVAGGRTDATVIGYIVQEQDASHNVIFEWRSWDHFRITDAAADIDLTAGVIDYVHGNAVEPDADGNLLISNRHMDEITKIDRETGNIIWRLGGENNQFTFIGDSLMFSHQHDIRRLPNGNISLFDNGNGHSPPFSRAMEYELDEVNKTAKRVWQFPAEPERYSVAMGNAQRLPNGNTMIGWGFPTAGPQKRIATEATPNGEKAFELILDTNTLSYRVFRFPWKGRSAAPYLWTEDRNNAKTDSVLLKMTAFGREDIVKYHIYSWDYPAPERLFDSTETNTIVLRNLQRGRRYLYRAVGVTADGEPTDYSERLEFLILPFGPVIVASLPSSSIGVAKVGTSVSISLPDFLGNDGEESLVISNIKIEGDGASQFALKNTTFPLTISPGSARDLSLQFTPASEGTKSARLVISSNAVNESTTSVAISADAVRSSIAGTDVRFGRVKPGVKVDSTVQEIIRNIGTTPLVITSLSITPDEFAILNPPPLPITIAPGESLALTICFVPAETGLREGTLRVVSDAEPSPLDIRLNGTGDNVNSVAGAYASPLRLSVRSISQQEGEALAITSAVTGEAGISIIDVQGRTVRRMKEMLTAGEERRILWDGTNDRGERAGSGRYIVQVAVGSDRCESTLLLFR